MSDDGYEITLKAFKKFNKASNEVLGFKGTPPIAPKSLPFLSDTAFLRVGSAIPNTNPVAYNAVAVVRNVDGVYVATERAWGADIILNHARNDHIPQDSIVKATLTSGEDGAVWLAELVTMYSSFKFIGVSDSNNTHSANGFVMVVGGDCHTNFGSFELMEAGNNGQDEDGEDIDDTPIVIKTGQICYAMIEFIKTTSSSSASESETPSATSPVSGFTAGDSKLMVVSVEDLPPFQQEDEDRLVRNVPIAEVTEFNLHLGFLVNYQTNDILMDISLGGNSYTFGDNPTPTPTPTPTLFSVDNKWLKIRNQNEIYHTRLSKEIAESGESSECNWKELLCMSTDFSCDSVAFSNISDVETWVNDIFLANIKKFLIDINGHIPLVSDCDGENSEQSDNPTTGPTSTPEMTFVLSLESSEVDIGTGDEIDLEALLEHDGAYFAEWNGVYNIKYTITIGGQAIEFEPVGEEGGLFVIEAINQYSVSPDKAGDAITVVANLECHYNETATINATIPNSGLSSSVTFETKVVTMELTADVAEVQDGQQLEITASLKDFGGFQFTDFDDDGIHLINFKLTWPNGDLVQSSEGGNFGVDAVFVDSSSASFTDTIAVPTNHENEVITVSAFVENINIPCKVNIDDKMSLISIEYPDAIITPEEVTLILEPDSPITTTDVEGKGVGTLSLIIDNTTAGGVLGKELG